MTFSAAWQLVKCSDCGRSYQCRPEDDYYHRPDVSDEERTLLNGVCESCLIPDDLKGKPVIDLTARPRG